MCIMYMLYIYIYIIFTLSIILDMLGTTQVIFLFVAVVAFGTQHYILGQSGRPYANKTFALRFFKF